VKQVFLRNADVLQSTAYRGMPQYPGRLVERLGDRAPMGLFIAGSSELVGSVDSGHLPSVALAVSVHCPASVVEITLALVWELTTARVVFVGGFHSPIERRCLDAIIVAGGKAVVCLARTLTDLRIARIWQLPLKEDKLVLVSISAPAQKRATRESVRVRNQCVLGLTDSLLIPHATPGGKAEALCREGIEAGKPVWAVDCPTSRNLLALGAKPVILGMATQILDPARRLAAASNPGK